MKDKIKVFGDINIPRALSEAETLKYLNRYKNGDYSAKEILIEHNIRLVIHIAKKYLNICDNFRIEFEDLVMNGIEGLIKGINSYNFDKNIKLSTYVYKCIDNQILIYLRKNKQVKSIISIYDIVSSLQDGSYFVIEEILEDNNISFLDNYIENDEYIKIRKIVESLSDREKELVKLYFGFYDNDRIKQKDLAKMTNLSQSYISRIIRTSKKKIKKRLIEEGISY